MTLQVLTPASSQELADLVKSSNAGLRIRGAGTWLAEGKPVRARAELSLAAFREIQAYIPADLTISVGAGLTLAELDAVTAEHGQWCPLLPWGSDNSTVGATIATGVGGPFSATLGRPRDLVLGVECVDGLGRVIQAGGRVVKNVAGFDLTRLMTGAWGTLGVITALHLRLRARPAVDRTWLVRPRDGAAWQGFLRGALAPLAATALTPRVAAAIGASAAECWLVRAGGNAAFVAATERALSEVAEAQEWDGAAWHTVRRELAPPSPAWTWSPLALRIKQRFDPRHQLNPGLLGEPA